MLNKGALSKENPHAGHRERMRKIILTGGIDSLPDHMVLEYILFYCLPRRDTNALAHALIDRFGSLRAVMDADPSELCKVDGVGENCAVFIKLIPQLCLRYSTSKLGKNADFTDLLCVADYLTEYYLPFNAEVVTMLLLDNSGGLIGHEVLHEGSLNSSFVNTRKIAEIALRKGAASIILAHNHPGGQAIPSDADLLTTKNLMDALSAIQIDLRAHILVAGKDHTDIVSKIYGNTNFNVKYIAVMQTPNDKINDDIFKI